MFHIKRYAIRQASFDGAANHDAIHEWVKNRQAVLRAERRRLARDVVRPRVRANAQADADGGTAGRRSLVVRRSSSRSAR
ncbi:MAG: hypothetical protein WBA29_14885 [Xanthobacteraceae bacterium]